METNGLKNPVLEEQFGANAETTLSTPEETISQQQETPPAVDFEEENDLLDASSQELDLGDYSEEEEQQDDANSVAGELYGKTKAQIVTILEEIIGKRPVSAIRKDIEAIKIAFYKIHRSETETQRKLFFETHSSEEPFVLEPDVTEIRLKELFATYRQKRDLYVQEIEEQKEKNYIIKQQIIEDLKDLLNSGETLNQTFNTFRELQHRWKESGAVPKTRMKDVWETYHLHVENFYNFIKINKELRDLDLKKNYESKIILCEEAEALLLESNITVAFKKLQKLHESWREVGPVSIEYKEELWARFKNVSTQINKRHQDYFDQIKEEQRKNLEMKMALCERAEALVVMQNPSRKTWETASEALIEIQKLWKTIGFAPKKDNARIYERFRIACDGFFEKKRAFFVGMKEEQENNLQNKIAICQRAETIAQGNEWKGGTDELVALQKQWKEIGGVSRKQSDAVWNRFRAACDAFFARKSEYYAGLDNQYSDNLAKKKAVIEELKGLDITAQEDGFELLKTYQRRWSEIGFVPIKEKDALHKEYRNLIDACFDALRSKGTGRKMERFKTRLNQMRSDGNERRLYGERERLAGKIKQLEGDVTLWENNIGFFAKSKNAQGLISDVNAKIEKAKEEIALLIQQVNIIDAEQ